MLQKNSKLARLSFILGSALLLFTLATKPLMLFDGKWHQWFPLSFFYFFEHYGFIFYIIGFGLLIYSLLFGSKKWLHLSFKLIGILLFWLGSFLLNPPYLNETYQALSIEESIDKEGIYAVVVGENSTYAYPAEKMMYYHVVSDTIDGENVLVTYCGMCRSFRAYSATVNENQLHFTTPYAYKNNSILQDKETGSWWLQTTGECIYGELKGQKLNHWGKSLMMKGSVLAAFSDVKLRNLKPNLNKDELNRLPAYRERLAADYKQNQLWLQYNQKFHDIPLSSFSDEKPVVELDVSDSTNITLIRLDEYSYLAFKSVYKAALKLTSVYNQPVIIDAENRRWRINGEPVKNHLPLELIEIAVEKPFAIQRFIIPSIPPHIEVN